MKQTILWLSVVFCLGVSPAPAKAQDVAPAAALPRTGAAIYEKSCAACHASGVGNAPRVGDRNRWVRLVREGPARVTAHGWLGERAMPARGGVADLALADFADAVAVMAQRSQVKWPEVNAMYLQAVEQEIKKEADKRARRAGSGKAASS